MSLTGADVVDRLRAAGAAFNARCQTLATAFGGGDAARQILAVLNQHTKQWPPAPSDASTFARSLREDVIKEWVTLCVDVKRYATGLGMAASKAAQADYEHYLFNIVLAQIKLEVTHSPAELSRPDLMAHGFLSPRDAALLRRDGAVVLHVADALARSGIELRKLRRDLALLYEHKVIAKTNSSCNPGAHGVNLRCGSQEEREAFVKQGTPTLLAATELLRSLPHELERCGYRLPGAELLAVPSVVLVSAYDRGARYMRHLDCYGDDNARALTIILYANEAEWDVERDGGALRLELDLGGNVGSGKGGGGGGRAGGGGGGVAAAREASPAGGTCVIFESRRIWHEVLPATGRERFALTLWVYGAQAAPTAALPPEAAALLELRTAGGNGHASEWAFACDSD